MEQAPTTPERKDAREGRRPIPFGQERIDMLRLRDQALGRTSPDYQAVLERVRELSARLQTRLFEAYRMPTYDQARDVAMQPSVMKDLFEIAEEARKLALNYRDFKVGAAMVGLKRIERGDENQNPWVVKASGNTMLAKGAQEPTKYCAEWFLLDDLEDPEQKFEKAVSFNIVGEPQLPDLHKEDTDKTLPLPRLTLIPCEHCQDMFATLLQDKKKLIDSDTLIATKQAGAPWEKLFTAEKFLKDYHGKHFHDNSILELNGSD